MKKRFLWPFLFAAGFLVRDGLFGPATAPAAPANAPAPPPSVNTNAPPPTATPPAAIPPGTIDPAVWGKAYPLYYQQWREVREAAQAGMSKYRGWDADDITPDTLSEYPYLALLLDGWGFETEHKEPRGHAYMALARVKLPLSRIADGGVCLTCKSPFAPRLEKEMGKDYYRDSYREVLAKIPQKDQDLGVACIDCHDPEDMSLAISRELTLGKALRAMGTDPAKLGREEMRSLVCAQCHATYDVQKNEQKETIGLYFPWQKGKFGKITIEDIIAQFRKDPTTAEWTQTVTGFRLPFIRHPQFELFSNDSIHWQAGAACSDCHMPLVKDDGAEIPDHRVTSPLKTDLHACGPCHDEDKGWLRQRVYDIQDRIASMEIRAGYGTATVAKLFESVHKAQKARKHIDRKLYDQAKEYYLDAFFRTMFIGTESSMGFHNPAEAARVLGDAIAFAGKAEGLLRQALAQAGVAMPAKINLDLAKYFEVGGTTRVPFRGGQEVKDPFGNQERF